jgi:hypothetical protein
MVLNPLDILKKGLKTLHDQVKAKKDQLQAQLTKGKSISSQEAEWLDGEANLVDEDRILEALEKASDYKQGLERLDKGQKKLVTKLQQAAKAISKSAGKKRMRTCVWLPFPFGPFLALTDDCKGPEDKPKGTQSPPENGATAAISKKKENATLEQRIEVLDWFNANGRNQSKTA